MHSLVVLGTFVLMTVLHIAGGLKWLALDRVPETAVWEKHDVCQKRYGLTGKQVRFCRNHFKWMKAVQGSAIETKEECQEQFLHRQWNCMSVNKAPKFDLDLRRDTREAAYLHALSSALLVLSASRSCMAGYINDCHCNVGSKHISVASSEANKTDLSFIDRKVGCKGIIKTGRKFASKFLLLGFRKTPQNLRQAKEVLVRRHNIDVGLNAVMEGEDIKCVCNGATAGCVVKYCYRRLVPVQKVAESLFQYYENATDAGIIAASTERSSDERSSAFKIPDSKEGSLVFLTKGTDYCRSQMGGAKVTRRLCELDPSKPNSCDKLCCERGYREKLIESVKKCDCKFVFCCKVQCFNTCRSTKRVYECL